MKKIVVIAGATASGKTSLAVALAKKLKAPIISADSRQFYKELSIGTAKPTPQEQKGIPHYFIDSHSVTTPVSSGKFEKEAIQLIHQLFKKNDTIILVGGSGMFINAVIYGTDQIPSDKTIREKWNKLHQEKGLAYLQSELSRIDPEYFQKVDKKNPVRLIRALEVYSITGKPFSELQSKQKKEHRFPTHFFVLDHPREKLYQRINQRVDLMMEKGLLEEVKRNAKFRQLQPLNTVGYKELFQYLDNEISLEEAIQLIKRNTRRYAKRQLTWFRKEKDAYWLPHGEIEDMISFIEERL